MLDQTELHQHNTEASRLPALIQNPLHAHPPSRHRVQSRTIWRSICSIESPARRCILCRRPSFMAPSTSSDGHIRLLGRHHVSGTLMNLRIGFFSPSPPPTDSSGFNSPQHSLQPSLSPQLPVPSNPTNQVWIIRINVDPLLPSFPSFISPSIDPSPPPRQSLGHFDSPRCPEHFMSACSCRCNAAIPSSWQHAYFHDTLFSRHEPDGRLPCPLENRPPIILSF